VTTIDPSVDLPDVPQAGTLGVNDPANALVRAWSSAAPILPTALLTQFAKANVSPLDPVGAWVIRTGVPALGSQKPLGPDVSEGLAASRVLGNPQLLAAIKQLPMSTQQDIFKMDASGVGVLDTKQLQRLLSTGSISPAHHGWLNTLGDWATTGIRDAFTTMQAGSEAVTALWRGASAAAPRGLINTGGNIGEALKPSYGTKDVFGIKWGSPEQTTDIADQLTLYQALHNNLSLGNGFFPLNSPANQAAVQAQRASANINSHALTPGRALASVVTEPGTYPYGMISGIVDATVAMQADPAYITLSHLSDSAKAARVFQATTEDARVSAARYIVDAANDSNAVNTVRQWTGRSIADQPSLYQAVADKIGEKPAGLQDLVKMSKGGITHEDVLHAIGVDSMGAGQAWRNYIKPQTFLQWVNSGKEAEGDGLGTGGIGFAKWVAQHGFMDLYSRMPKVDVGLLGELDMADTPAQVRNILTTAAGEQIHGVPAGLVPYTWKRLLSESRLFNYLPKGYLDFEDLDSSVQKVHQMLVNARVDPVGYDAILGDLARSQTKTQFYDAYKQATEAVRQELIGRGVARDLATKLTRWQPDDSIETAARFVDVTIDVPHITGFSASVGAGGNVTRAFGDTVPLSGPHLESELFNRTLPLLDSTEINRTVGRLRSIPEDANQFAARTAQLEPGVVVPKTWGEIWNHPVIGPMVRGSTYLADHITGAFKIGALSRVGMMIRFLADEHARMATDGLESLWNHPIDLIHNVIGHNFNVDELGNNWVDQLGNMQVSYQRAVGQSAGWSNTIWNADTQLAKHYVNYPRESSNYLSSWMNEITHLHGTATAREVARALEDPSYAPAGLRAAEGEGIAVQRVGRAAEEGIGESQGVGFSMAEGRTPYARTGETATRQVVHPSNPLRVPAADNFELPGEAAIKQVLGTDTYEQFRQAMEARDLGVMGRLAREVGATPQEWPDVSHAIDDIGAQVARNAGYDAIVHGEPGSRFGSYIALQHSALASVSPPSTGLDAVKEWIWSGAGQKYRQEMADARLWNGRSMEMRFSRQASDAWVDSIANRVNIATGGDGDVLGAIAHGQPFSWGAKGVKVDPAFRDLLSEMRLQEEGPAMIRGRAAVGTRGQGGLFRKMVDGWLSLLMDTPTRTLTRGPAFKESYLERFDELRPYIADGTIDATKADLIAKSHALNRVRDLLYYPGERANITEKLRNIVPFGEAWRNVAKTWARLGAEDPQVFRRVQQGIQTARSSGFFYPDQNGQEVMTFIPGGIMKALTGAPFPVTGKVQGINLIGNGLPGVGPAIQIPANALLPKGNAESDWLRQHLLPYGSPDYTGGFYESLFPGWLDKLRTSQFLLHYLPGNPQVPWLTPSADKKRVLGTLANAIAGYHMSTGHYDLSQSGVAEKLMKQSMWEAQKMYLIKGAAQFVAPSAPKEVPMSQKDNTQGALLEQWKMVKDWQAMENLYPTLDQAVGAYVDKYGVNNIFTTEPSGQRQIYGVPTSEEAAIWRSNHGGFADQYKNTYGYFVPQTSGFDYQAYLDAINRGEIKPLDVQTWLKLADARIGNMIYANLRSKVGASPNKAESAWLAENKARIQQQYPGFNDQSIQPSRAQRPQLIDELRGAVTDPAVARTPVAQAASIYMNLRDEALTALGQAGGRSLEAMRLTQNPFDAKSAEQFRAWLYDNGNRIAMQYPEFQNLWQNVFLSEVEPQSAAP
jgi:hypothetical protein